MLCWKILGKYWKILLISIDANVLEKVFSSIFPKFSSIEPVGYHYVFTCIYVWQPVVWMPSLDGFGFSKLRDIQDSKRCNMNKESIKMQMIMYFNGDIENKFNCY